MPRIDAKQPRATLAPTMASPITMSWQRRIRRPWRRSVVVRGMPGRLWLGDRRALGACLLGVAFDPLAAGRVRVVGAARRRRRGRPVRGAAAGGRARGLRQSGGTGASLFLRERDRGSGTARVSAHAGGCGAGPAGAAGVSAPCFRSGAAARPGPRSGARGRRALRSAPSTSRSPGPGAPWRRPRKLPASGLERSPRVVPRRRELHAVQVLAKSTCRNRRPRPFRPGGLSPGVGAQTPGRRRRTRPARRSPAPELSPGGAPGVRNGITSDSSANEPTPGSFPLSGWVQRAEAGAQTTATDGQDWPFRMARRQGPVSPVRQSGRAFRVRAVPSGFWLPVAWPALFDRWSELFSTDSALNGRVKTGHLWTPQNRPFPAARDWS